MKTETNVENINSIIKRIDDGNESITFENLIRRVMLRLMIPKDHSMRTVVVRLCAKAFELKYMSQVLKTNKKRSNKKGVAVSPSIDKALKKRIKSLYTLSILLRQSALVRL